MLRDPPGLDFEGKGQQQPGDEDADPIDYCSGKRPYLDGDVDKLYKWYSIHRREDQTLAQSAKGEKKYRWWCYICQVAISTLYGIPQHVQGRKHRRNVSNIRRDLENRERDDMDTASRVPGKAEIQGKEMRPPQRSKGEMGGGNT